MSSGELPDSARRMSAPSTPRKKRIMDRYIPQREGINLQAAYSLTPQEEDNTYNSVLRTELLGNDVQHSIPSDEPSSSPDEGSHSVPLTPRKAQNLFNYSPGRRKTPSRYADPFSSSPVRGESQKLLLSNKKKVREIASSPYKVLDAPELADDFYLNLLDWGSQNQLAVGLGSLVYVWDAQSGVVEEVCNLGEDTVASISWIKEGTHLAVGTSSGPVQIWDVNTTQRLRQMSGHNERACSLSWNRHLLSSGSRDCTILHRDVRIAEPYVERLSEHTGEVCGLKWNVDNNQLASGCNDNKLMVWNGLERNSLFQFNEHKAAVKALAWSPHQQNLLASGGGTCDRKIWFWNTTTGLPVNSIDTGSQVCNLIWSENSKELVSTHGYALNNITVWKYPTMQQVATLHGHTYRVLYLALSPDGKTIATGAGDETLRLWNVFPSAKRQEPKGPLKLFTQIR